MPFAVFKYLFLWMLLSQHPLCHHMCNLGANKIMRNAINLTSITLRWILNSSRQSVFSTTSDGSQQSPNDGKSRRSVYLVKIGPKSLGDVRTFARIKKVIWDQLRLKLSRVKLYFRFSCET